MNNIPQMFLENSRKYGNKPFLWRKEEAAFDPVTWGEARIQVLKLASFLKSKGIQKGDRVLIVSENRPEWMISDLAIMALGAWSIPAYTTNTAEDHQFLMEDGSPKAVVVGKNALLGNVLKARENIAEEKRPFLICLDPSPLAPQDWSIDYKQILKPNLDSSEEISILEGVMSLTRKDISSIIYTSGTGGNPKGVLTTHGAILSNCETGMTLIKKVPIPEVDQIFMSCLPASHAFERTAGQIFPMLIGAQIYYNARIDALSKDIALARPTMMIAVPRLYEVFHSRILGEIERSSPVIQKLFAKYLEVSTKRLSDPDTLSFFETLTYKTLDLIIGQKIRGKFGGRLILPISGGARLDPALGTFFHALGIPVLEGYGQTECAPIITVNNPVQIRIGTVGQPALNVDVKLAEDGEVIVRGEVVMAGYYNNPKATAEAIRDGWLHTGDIGAFDEDGYLKIVDRKKHIIVTSGGDTFSPQKIEGVVTQEREIGQAVVVGDGQSYLTAILVPSQELLDELKNQTHKLQEVMQQAVDSANKKLANLEKIRRFVVSSNPFTVDNGFMTPTLKIKRDRVIKEFKDQLDQLYSRKKDK